MSEKEKFRRWDNETARQESPQDGRGVSDRVLRNNYSAGRNEAVLREHVGRQYERTPAQLDGHIREAIGFGNNLVHDPSKTPAHTKPNSEGTRQPRKEYTPGGMDVLRSIDGAGAQAAASTARTYADAQSARSKRKGIPTSYTREQRQMRRDLRVSSRGIGRNLQTADHAKAALKAMPQPDASANAWRDWAKAHGQTLPSAPSSVTPPVSLAARAAAVSSRASQGLARINPAMMLASSAVAATTAFKASKVAGGSTSQAVGNAAVAGAPLATAAAAPTVIGRFAPAAAGVLSRLALPLTAAAAGIGAVRGGVAAYKAGKGAGAIAKEAALGAADALTFGLASQVHAKVGGDPTSLAIVQQAAAARKAAPATASKPGGDPTGGPQRLPPSDAREYQAANDKFAQQSQSQPSGKLPPGYKDQWTDSRGRQYHRQDLSVRTAKGDA